MKETTNVRLVYSAPTCEVFEFSEQEILLAGSPPEVNPGNGNVRIIGNQEEEEEISGARKWNFWEEDSF